jgi:hypothetical protein
MSRYFLCSWQILPRAFFISKKSKEAYKMQNLKRNINMGFRVNEEEQEMIRRRMGQMGMSRL